MGRCMLVLLQRLIKKWKDTDAIISIDLPQILDPDSNQDSYGDSISASLSDDDTSNLMLLARTIVDSKKTGRSLPEQRNNKRRKLDIDGNSLNSSGDESEENELALIERVEDLLRKYHSLFEWVDGPLVTAMKQGHMILLDEMSLADDAVLERLNSVLEPSRILILAEKGLSGDDDNPIIKANNDFQLFGTMNPGGDFGKRELSPALRSRFTEIWVPSITERSDIDLVLERSLTLGLPCEKVPLVKKCILDYVEWFNEKQCKNPRNPCPELSLSMRDILTWAEFAVQTFNVNNELGLNDLLLHGARLMHLDGIGLGMGLSSMDVNDTKQKAECFILDQLHSLNLPCDIFQPVPNVEVNHKRFGVSPFWIATGCIETVRPNFYFQAPTTALNIQRVVRAMQLRKPVLLEGSPGKKTLYT